MQGIETIVENGRIYAIIVRNNFCSADKYNFLTPIEYPLQLGANFYSAGEEIKKHYHPDKEVSIRSVQEFIVVNRGRLRVLFFDDNQEFSRDAVLEQGDMIFLASGGHGFEVLEDTTIVEIKQGPYAGVDDKVLF